MYVRWKTGYIGYIVDNQRFNRLQKRLHTSYIGYTVDVQSLTFAIGPLDESHGPSL